MLLVYILRVLYCKCRFIPSVCFIHSSRGAASCQSGAVSFCSMKEYAKGFYKSAAWKDCRKKYAEYRRGLCERCLSRGIYKPGEIVHHVVHITPDNINDPAVTLSFRNLQLVCRECHAELHDDRVKRWKVDAAGRVTAPL